MKPFHDVRTPDEGKPAAGTRLRDRVWFQHLAVILLLAAVNMVVIVVVLPAVGAVAHVLWNHVVFGWNLLS